MNRTTKKQADESRLYREIVENMSEGVFLIRASDGIIVYANRAIEQIFGYASGELVGKHISAVNAPTDKSPEEVAREIIQSLKANRIWQGEVENIKKDRTVFWCHANVSTFEHPQHGNVWISIHQDITERKRAEQALRESEWRHRIVSELTADSVFVADVKPGGIFKIQWVSGGVFKIIEQTPEEIGSSDLWGKIIHPDDWIGFFSFMKDVLSTAEARKTECRVIHKQGGIRWVEVFVQPMTNAEHVITTVVGAIKDVTSRKQTEEALRESENTLRVWLNAIQESALLIDREGIILAANETVAQRIHHTVEEMIGARIFSFVPPEVAQTRHAYLAEVIRSGKPTRFEDERFGRIIDNIIYPVFDHDGQIRQLAILANDITERKRAEEALVESENRLRAIVESEPECVKILDIDGKLLAMNPAGLAMIEADSLEQVAGASVFGLIAPEHRAAFKVLNDRIFAGEAGMLEFEMVGLKGGRHVMETHAVPLRNSQGAITSLLGVTRDITERKRAEEALRKSEEQFRNLAQALPSAVYILDVSTRKAIYFNHDIFLGYSRAELLAENSIFSALHPEDASAVAAYWKRVMNGGLIAPIEYRARHKEGGWEWVNNRAVVLSRGADGMPLQVMLILDVVTERKRTEEALMASEEKWRLLVKAIPDYVSLHDSEGRFLFLNHYAEGFSEKDVIGSSVFQYLSPKSLDTFKMSIEKCHATGTLQTFEHTAMGDYDIMREYEDYVVPLIEKNGPPTTLLVSRDVTARKRAEEALRESQEIFSLFMHHSPIYAYIKTVTPAESRVLQASDNYIEMIGVSGADMAGKTMQELFPPEFAAKITADDWAVVTRGEVLKLDEDLNGRHYTTIKFPLTQGNKTLLAGYTIDITERKQVEEDLKQANKHLEEQLGQIKILRDYLREQATRDPLTGLYNRRYLHETMERELARAKRENYPISVLMIDIDHFKNFNDMHGHQAGDEILIALGGLLHASVRQGDIACRYGGEEFIIIMPGVHEVDAERRAEAIRNDFCKLRVNYGGVDLSATTSVGIAFFPQHGDSMNEIIKAADAALYEAKQAGRNCVRVWKKE